MQTRGCESLVYRLGRIGHLRAPFLFCSRPGWRLYSRHLVSSRSHQSLVFHQHPSQYFGLCSTPDVDSIPPLILLTVISSGITTSWIPYSWGLTSVLGTPGNSAFVQLVTRALFSVSFSLWTTWKDKYTILGWFLFLGGVCVISPVRQLT